MAATSIDVTGMAGWETIRAFLPEDYEVLAKENKALEVQYGNAKITSADDLLRLILLHAGANVALRQTVVMVAASGGVDVSHVTLHKKMRLAAPFLRALVQRLAGDPAPAERWAGYEVAVVDASTFCGPGAEGTDARVHLQLRLSDLEILDAIMEDRSVGETLRRFNWRAGQLALGDRVYANPPGIAAVVEQGADVLVRVNRSALPMREPSGEPVVVIDWLRSLRGYKAAERRVVVRNGDIEIRGRLIGMRLRPAEAGKARARLRRELGSGNVSFLDLEAAEYVVLFTTVPASRMPAVMCIELYRLRWQIELAFKRWKSICHFDRLPNYRDDTILSWLYAKLLLGLIAQKMASGPSALFPPEPEETEEPMDFDAMEGRDHRLARSRRRAASA